MLAKRNKFNLSMSQNREILRSFQQSFTPNFSIRFAQQAIPTSMITVGKSVSNSAVKRNEIKRKCYEVLEERLLRGDKNSYVVRVQKPISAQDVKAQLIAEISKLSQ